jgi:oxysterol-binding protein 1
VNGKIVDANGQTRWSLGGRWNDKLYARPTPGYDAIVDSASYQAFLIWEAHERPDGIPFNLTPFVVTLNALPERLKPLLPRTDTRLRPDQRAMEDGEYDFAATEKNRVEEKQRAKRRERERKGDVYKPRWFTKTQEKTTGEDYWHHEGEYWRNREAVAKGGDWQKVEDIF